jgi:hypothetical protein
MTKKQKLIQLIQQETCNEKCKEIELSLKKNKIYINKHEYFESNTIKLFPKITNKHINITKQHIEPRLLATLNKTLCLKKKQ